MNKGLVIISTIIGTILFILFVDFLVQSNDNVRYKQTIESFKETESIIKKNYEYNENGIPPFISYRLNEIDYISSFIPKEDRWFDTDSVRSYYLDSLSQQ